mgnify:CR=1 FL=1
MVYVPTELLNLIGSFVHVKFYYLEGELNVERVCYSHYTIHFYENEDVPTTDRDDKHAAAEEQETETNDPDAGKPIATSRIVSKGKKAKGGKHKRGRRRAKRGGST